MLYIIYYILYIIYYILYYILYYIYIHRSALRYKCRDISRKQKHLLQSAPYFCEVLQLFLLSTRQGSSQGWTRTCHGALDLLFSSLHQANQKVVSRAGNGNPLSMGIWLENHSKMVDFPLPCLITGGYLKQFFIILSCKGMSIHVK